MLDVFRTSKNLMGYWSFRSEVYTHQFLKTWQNEKEIAIPSIDGDTMVARKFNGSEYLMPKSPYGIPEPTGLEVNPAFIDLVIVPGAVFDTHNNRIGYGKGFYDKFLTNTRAYKIGVCFGFQIIDEIPSKPHDIRMDMILTDD
jgi:5-formyltetrahydrofolate cyclo-ligase